MDAAIPMHTVYTGALTYYLITSAEHSRTRRCLHRVVDGKAVGDRAAGRIDVEMDGLGGVLGFEEEQLGHDAAGDGRVDGRVETDDAVL